MLHLAEDWRRWNLYRYPDVPRCAGVTCIKIHVQKIKETVEDGGVISDGFGVVMSSSFIQNRKIEQEDTKEREEE